MNKQSAYWLCREFGPGTAIDIGEKAGLTNRDDFASHLSYMATKDKFLLRTEVDDTSTRFSYSVAMMTPTIGKGKNKKTGKSIIDPDSAGEKWFNQKDNQKKALKDIDILNNMKRKKCGKTSPSLTPASFAQAGMDEDDLLLMRAHQRAIAAKSKMRNYLKSMIEPSIKQLLENGLIITITYNKQRGVFFNYADYNSIDDDETQQGSED